MLIFPADRIVSILESKKLGVNADIAEIDFQSIMNRMRKEREKSQEYQKNGINQVSNLDYYQGDCYFIDKNTIQVRDIRIKGKKIFIGTGARPLIPPINGLDKVNYLTNESLLELTTCPDSLIIIGGGYIAVEYAHFFAAMGSTVTILEKLPQLVSYEEPEISHQLKEELQKRMKVFTGIKVIKVIRRKDSLEVIGKSDDGSEERFTAEKILVATGRKSNADLLHIENTDVELDEQGFIKVDDFLQTSQSNIWAFGDAIGKHMFKHVANEEASIAAHNGLHDEKIKMQYHAVPHAVFSYPQIASVGLTQKQAEKKGYNLLVGTAQYDSVAKGQAMMESTGFAKAIIKKEDYRILGFHIIGPYAPMIIQEVITIMSVKGEVGHIGMAMHIHPALPELIQRVLANIEEV
ncbi:MAG: dihydrolipoyl dehydrogenase [Candidatus Thermoplasmatota archaeon]|nr:dihydrolipoyl dehydrogenase [Candidatus Thermoplasmatota archaeon]